MWRSVRQTPHANMRSRTCPGAGSGFRNSPIRSGRLRIESGDVRTAAFMASLFGILTQEYSEGQYRDSRVLGAQVEMTPSAAESKPTTPLDLYCCRQVISTCTGISFLTGIVSKVGGSILKSVRVAGIVPVILVSSPCFVSWKVTCLQC